MTIVGGLRERLLMENLKQWVYDNLDELGWFDPGRRHMPVQVLNEPYENLHEITANVVALSEEELDTFEAELGSNLTEFRWEFAIDIYAETSAVGRHLWGDIRGILEGRFSSIGNDQPQFTVYDRRQATPPALFVCQVENVVGGRQREWSKPFQKYWWTIIFHVVDLYGNEDDPD